MSPAVVIPFAPKTTDATLVLDRYERSYATSRKTSDFAETVGLAGIAVAGVLWLIALIVYQAFPRERAGFPVATLVLVGIALWILLASRVIRRGFLAHGQLLQSVIDSAVAGSPFLTNPQRVQVMGLRRLPALEGWECARVRDRALAEQQQSAPRTRPVWIWQRPA